MHEVCVATLKEVLKRNESNHLKLVAATCKFVPVEPCLKLDLEGYDA